jgi:hypothetical protein
MHTRHATTKRKRCIVEETEISIASLYDEGRLAGLYPSDPPSGFMPQDMWVVNDKFWREILVRKLDFPVAKVSRPGMIGTTNDRRLKACTKFMNRDFFHYYNYTLYNEKSMASLQ